MKKTVLAAAVLALLLLGCTQDRTVPAAVTTEAAETLPEVTVPETTVPENTRPLTDTRIFYAEGDPYEIPATLYREADYSLYIPDGEWKLVGPASWVYVYNNEISFRIEQYTDISGFDLEQEFYRQGFDLDGARIRDGIRETFTVMEADGHVAVFLTAYPDSTEMTEGAGQALGNIRKTFLWELYD